MAAEESKEVRFDGESDEIITIPPPASPPRPALAAGKQQSQHFDLATGRRTQRSQSVQHLTEHVEAQSRWQKVRHWITSSSQTSLLSTQHFRIRSKSGETILDSFAGLWFSNTIQDYLRWTFRASFLEVCLSSYVAFLLLIIVFALGIWAVGQYQPECILVGSAGDFQAAKGDFVNAFHLSWTTLSTVGYGVLAPRVSTVEPSERCFAINFFMAVEAFVGVLFGGIVGAVIFGKVARIQSIAQIQFSDPMCLRYGTGCMVNHDNDSSDDDDKDETAEDNLQLPCPILEFRMVNELNGSKGGEIMNATVNLVATTLADLEQAEQRSIHRHSTSEKAKRATKKAVKRTGKAAKQTVQKTGKMAKQTGAALFGTAKGVTKASGTLIQRLHHGITGTASPREGQTPEETAPFNAEQKMKEELQEKLAKELLASNAVSVLEAARTSVLVDEGDSTLAPPRIFHKLDVETDSHPFFKRTWNIRHVLDQNSPLLTRKARKAIADNKGYWPEAWNSHEAVRSRVRFHEIMVNFSGTANVSGSSVFGQKVYRFSDVNVGYTFARMMDVDAKGNLIVDVALLNDVTEQNGGGGEPLNVQKEDPNVVEKAATAVVETGKVAVGTAQKAADIVTDTVTRTGEAVNEKVRDLVSDNKKSEADEDAVVVVNGDADTSSPTTAEDKV